MKRKDYLDPLVSSKQNQVRNLVQFRVPWASTSFMHKHSPSEQTFLCGTNHASRACQQRTKTERKECTSLQIQKAHTLASLGKLCTKAPTEWGEKRKPCQCFPRAPGILRMRLRTLLILECAGDKLVVRKTITSSWMSLGVVHNGCSVFESSSTHNLA